jgi:MFS family permease
MRLSIYESITGVVIFQLLSGPYLTGYLIHLGANAAQIGLVLAIPPLANVIQLLSAWWMQRVKSRLRPIVLGLGFTRIVWVLTGFIPFILPQEAWVITFILMFFLSWVAAAASSLIWSSLISDIVPEEVRGRFFGIRNTIAFTMGSISIMIGGLLLERYPGGVGFALIYAISGILVVINIIQLSLHPDPPFIKSEAKSDRELFLKPLRDRLFFGTTAFLSVWIFLQNLVIPLFTYVMLDILKLPYFPHVSVIMTIQNIAMVASFYIWGRLNGRISTQKLLLWTLPILALCCMAWGMLEWMPVFIVLVMVHILLGIGAGGFNQLAFVFVVGDTPKTERPMYIAFFGALTGFMGFVGPVVGGLIYEWLRPLPEWLQIYGFSLAVGCLLMVLAIFIAPRFLSGGGTCSGLTGILKRRFGRNGIAR